MLSGILADILGLEETLNPVLDHFTKGTLRVGGLQLELDQAHNVGVTDFHAGKEDTEECLQILEGKVGVHVFKHVVEFVEIRSVQL